MADEWLAHLAERLGVEPLQDDEVDLLLAVARDVAHGSERRYAPLSTFLAGVAAARAVDRPATLGEVAGTVRRHVDDGTA